MTSMTVYTCEVGGYDVLSEPTGHEPDIEFICFTDQPDRRVRGWQLRPLHEAPVDDPGLVNRWHKCFPHRLGLQTDWSIYVDSNIRIAGPLRKHIETIASRKATIACPLHTRRERIADEITACESVGKLDQGQAAAARERIAEHRSKGMPEDARLFENNIVLRHHADPVMHRFSETWWSEILAFHGRDQLALPCALWKTGTNSALLGENAFDGLGTFHHYAHRQEGLQHLAQFVSLRRHRLPYSMVYRLLKPLFGSKGSEAAAGASKKRHKASKGEQ